MKKPYIIIDGLDGAGKTTAMESLISILTEAGYEVDRSREPGGTPLAEHLRSTLKEEWGETISPKTDLMLFYAAREQLYTNIIKDTIKKNRKAFVQDRCWMSTYAYQVKGLERISTSDFWVIHNLIMKNAPKPDLAIYLDIPPEVGFRRIQSGRDGNESDRLEGYDLAFYERARAGYLELASRPEHNISVIDANQDIESVTEDIRALVEQLIKG